MKVVIFYVYMHVCLRELIYHYYNIFSLLYYIISSTEKCSVYRPNKVLSNFDHHQLNSPKSILKVFRQKMDSNKEVHNIGDCWNSVVWKKTNLEISEKRFTEVVVYCKRSVGYVEIADTFCPIHLSLPQSPRVVSKSIEKNVSDAQMQKYSE